MNNRTGIFCAYGSTMEFTFPFRRGKREIAYIRHNLLSDPFTTLLLRGVKKYYDGSVAFYILNLSRM